MKTAVPLVLLCICLHHNHARTAATPAVTRSASNASTAHTEQSPAVPQSDSKSHSQQELDILQLLGWQNAYNPAGYAISTELPANCTTQTWQSLGSLAALTDLSLTLGSLLNLPDSWAATGAFPSLSTLNLSSTTLTGTLPASWGSSASFPNLTQLILANTGLAGTLPPEWGSASALQQLMVLSITSCNISGAFPTTWSELGAFPLLTNLSLNSVPITGPLPLSWASITSFPRLKSLYLKYTNLTGVLPPEWGSPTAFLQLQSFEVYTADITGTVPSAWAQAGAFRALKGLALINLPIWGTLPPAWANEGCFPFLEILQIGANPDHAGVTKLTGTLPASWGSPTAFQRFLSLSLFGVKLTGTLPVSWSSNGSFPLLTELDLEDMHVRGTLPSTWGAPTAFRQLQKLTITGTNITGGYPDTWQQLWALPALQVLDFSANQLTGHLPLALPASLVSLNLSNNAYVGSLPPVWASDGVLPSLQYLWIIANQLTGPLLPSWPPKLLQLELSTNDLTGSLPSTGWPSQLQVLDLSKNRLSSSIPKALSSDSIVPQLQWVELEFNQLTGTLPASWPPYLQTLQLDNNNLAGTLPSAWSTMRNLQQMGLSGNTFTGELPSAWAAPGAFPELIEFECENTSVTGSLPETWGSPIAFQSLELLFLSGTTFIGTLPDSWAAAGAFPQLDLISLQSTTITGTIPASWASQTAFPRLQVLDLSHTRLQGSLPAFDNINLGVLNLHDCNLSSDLASFWSSASPLLAASLARNVITGTLPDNSTALDHMVFLDTSSNQIEGTVPLSWLLPNSFLSHVVYFDLGSVWQQSAELTNWRQQLCLKPDLYNPDILAKQLVALPRLQDSSDKVSEEEFAGRSFTSWDVWLDSNNSVSIQWLAVKLKGVDNPHISYVQQSGMNNQLTSVKSICAGSSKVLLIVWLTFAACCAAMLSVYFILKRRAAKPQPLTPGLMSCVVLFMFRSLHGWKAVAAVYPVLKGLVGLAFYYYDLVTSIIVLVQLWDKWPGHILVAIFFLHFATTGIIVAIRAVGMSHAKLFGLLPANVYQRSGIVLLCLVCCPVSGLVVVLLDTIALAVHLFACVKFLAGLVCAHLGCAGCSEITCCRLSEVTDSLSWIDLENYESMHNLIAAVMQSLPTVVLNSVLFSAGNKPSHGLFLSNTLFITSIVASCLAMLKCLALMLWEAHTRSVSLLAHVLSVASGKTLQAESQDLGGQVSQVVLLTQQQPSVLVDPK